MIYNLVEYLRTELPTETIYVNGRVQTAAQANIPDRNILVTESSGQETPWFKFVRKGVQILTRDYDVTDARKLAWSVYNLLTSRFGLILPAITVDGEVFPQIQVAQIAGVSQPYLLGADEEGRIEFTTNYIVIYGRA